MNKVIYIGLGRILVREGWCCPQINGFLIIVVVFIFVSFEAECGNPTVGFLKQSDPPPLRLTNSAVPFPVSNDQVPPAPPAQSGVDRKLWIQNVLLKIDRMRNDADAQIKKADASILKGQKLLSQAQSKGNTQVATTVQRTIAQAREVKKKNELNKVRAEEAIARVQNLLAKMSGENIPVQAVVSHVSGTVFLKDRNGKFVPLNENRTYLEPGDEIQTLNNSRAEFQMLEGDGTVTMGANTKLQVTNNGLEREILDVFEGKIRMIKVKVVQHCKKIEVRTPTGCGAIRGTEFLVSVAPDQTSEILLLEGKLEVQSLKGTNSVLLEAGDLLRMPTTGVFSEPVAIDLNTVPRWWDDN